MVGTGEKVAYGMQQQNPWKTLETAIRFENPWFRVVQNDVITPGGSPGEYTVVDFKNRAVGIVPVDAEHHTWLVGQYRYAVDSFEWEVPAGGCPLEESTLHCAQRELAEETGLHADQWTMFADGVQLSNSITNERGYCFLATGLQQHAATPEDTEQLTLRRLPLEEAWQLVADGTIRDGFSVIALLRLQQQVLTGQIQLP